MTAYGKFLQLTNAFLNNEREVIAFCDLIDDLWFKDKAVIYSRSVDKHATASDIMMLCDKYDDCDEIVKHDSYCINEETLRNRLI